MGRPDSDDPKRKVLNRTDGGNVPFGTSIELKEKDSPIFMPDDFMREHILKETVHKMHRGAGQDHCSEGGATYRDEMKKGIEESAPGLFYGMELLVPPQPRMTRVLSKRESFG